MTKEQAYYEFLTKTDHPVFFKDFSDTADINVNSPLNSILNLVFAKQLVKFKERLDELRLNMYPSTVTALMIDDWEYEYFGFTKQGTALQDRVNELVIKVNKRFRMNIFDVVDLSESIVGIRPIVVRNINKGGWTLGTGILGLSTIFGGSNFPGRYVVSFSKTADSSLLKRLDQKLIIIEKAGSAHTLYAPI